MKCPLCNLEMYAVSHKLVFENDDTPDKETKAFTEIELMCRNKNCANHERIVSTEKIPFN